MRNLEMTISDDEILTIQVNLRDPGVPSKNPRTNNQVLGTSGGALPLVNSDGTFRAEKINCSIYRPRLESDE